MSLSDNIYRYLTHADRPVTTREITDAMPEGTPMPSVSAWIHVSIRRGLVRKVNQKRPITYALVTPIPSGSTTASRRSRHQPISTPADEAGTPPQHIQEVQRRINRSQLHMHLAIQQAITGQIDQIIHRVTTDAIKRYLDLQSRGD